jgi:LPPG:FO 2-phospho-L-lactate transferase
MIVVLAGGVGAARFLRGLVEVVAEPEITVIGNTGDDAILHGLYVSPDLDTVTYTLAGAVNGEQGWGLAGDSFRTMEALDRYGVPTWFRLGDLDLATHLFRTARLAEGAALSEVTAEIVRAWGIGCKVLPMSDDTVRTRLRLTTGAEVDFQEYFVRLCHAVAVASISYRGASAARPAPGVIGALTLAEAIVLAPSNPLLSIGPILAVPGIAEALAGRRERVVAISPIVGGRALRGPADHLLAELGHEASAVGVARLVRRYARCLVIDTLDADLSPKVGEAGVRAVVADTVMRTPEVAAALARTALASVLEGRP